MLTLKGPTRIVFVVLLTAAALTLMVYRAYKAFNPTQEDYYNELNSRLYSGDARALDELIARLENGPSPLVVRAISESRVQGIPVEEFGEDYETWPAQSAAWIRENKERLVFDPQLKMFCLRDGPASRPAAEDL